MEAWSSSQYNSQPASRAKRLKRRAAGFSLLEALISLQILSVAALAVSQSFATNIVYNKRAEQKSGAVFAAQQVIDELRAQKISQLPNSGRDPLRVVTVGTSTYTVEISYCSTPAFCSVSMRHIVAKSLYKGVSKYEVEAVLAELE